MSPEADLDKNLLSDDEFAALMLSGYAAEKQAVDPCQKERIWKKVETALNQSEPQKKGFVKSWGKVGATIGLAATLLIAFVSFETPEQEQFRVKGVPPPESPPTLTVHSLSAAGDLSPLSEENLSPGTTLVFKVATKGSARAQAYLFLNDSEPVPVGEPLLGEGFVMTTDSNAFAYELNEGEEGFALCAKNVNDSPLERSLESLVTESPSSCFVFPGFSK